MAHLDPPPGFAPLDRQSPLLAPWRPLFARSQADRTVIGLHVRDAHTNSRGTVHGGLFAALADQAMGMSCAVKLRAEGRAVEALWTTSMTVDYLGVARPGQWLEFDTVFSRGGASTCHAEADIRADGHTVARSRAAFRLRLQPTNKSPVSPERR